MRAGIVDRVNRMETIMNNTSTLNRATHGIEKHSQKAARFVVDVAVNEAASIDMHAGAALQAISGKVWLTQEGDSRDHVLIGGTTFCTDRSGRVVLTGIDAPAVVLVWKAAARHCVPGTISIDSMRRIALAAQAARSELVAAAFVS